MILLAAATRPARGPLSGPRPPAQGEPPTVWALAWIARRLPPELAARVVFEDAVRRLAAGEWRAVLADSGVRLAFGPMLRAGSELTIEVVIHAGGAAGRTELGRGRIRPREARELRVAAKRLGLATTYAPRDGKTAVNWKGESDEGEG